MRFVLVQKNVDQMWLFFEWKFKIQINSGTFHFLWPMAFKSYRPDLKPIETDWSTNEFVGIYLPVIFLGQIIPNMRFKFAFKALW